MNPPIKKGIIIGSYALGVRPSNDIDVVCYEADVEQPYTRKDDYTGFLTYKGHKVELLFADKQKSFQVLLEDHDNTVSIAPPELLFAIKKAHINRPHKQWEKHIMDYHILRGMSDTKDFSMYTGVIKQLEAVRAKGAMSAKNTLNYFSATSYMVKQYDFDAFVKLHKESTADRIGKQKTPRLTGVSKEEFFDDLVVKHYDHDDIHQWFAHRENPMYTYMQLNPNTVECSKHLWDNFSFEHKIQCVMEECYVIASERHLIPFLLEKKGSMNPYAAFRWALMRVCTTLCSGWFRDFAVENYFDILNGHNRDYSTILKQNM